MQPQHLKEVFLEKQRKIDGMSFPKIYQPSVIRNFFELEEYFMMNYKNIIDQVNRFGAVLFKGFDVKSANEYASVMNKLGLKSFEYIGGAAVRKLIIGNDSYNQNRNVEVFTTNEAPPSQSIPFHNQLLQTPNYPQYISFYCYSEAETGGSTPIVSSQELYQFVLSSFPEFLKKLQELEVRYIRVVGPEDNPKSPIGRGWKNIFKVSNRQQAEKEMQKGDYQYKWLQNEHCQMISKKLKATSISKSGKKVFCNQMIAVFKGWMDELNSPEKCLKFGNFEEIPAEIMKAISEYALQIQVVIPWCKGDFIIIDNQMTAHARQPFTGTSRKIYASLYKHNRNLNNQSYLTLNSGDLMPAIGFGTWKISKQDTFNMVYNAIQAGYKLLDCACVYGNQQFVGQALNKIISQGIAKRQQLFITSKLWNTFHHPSKVRQGFMKTLKDLNLKYLDLYLIHFPIALKYVPIQVKYPPQWIHDQNSPKPCMQEDNVPILDTWREMQKLKKEGLVRNIGVSNFNVALLRDLINGCQISPSVLQVQIHPWLTQKNLIRFCRQKGIQVTSYSTFGATSYVQLSMSQQSQTINHNQVICQIAKSIDKTPFQVALRWAIQQGLAVIPKTSNQGRLKQNQDLIGWRLTDQQMNLVDSLNKNRKFNDPAVFCEKAFNTFFPLYD